MDASHFWARQGQLPGAAPNLPCHVAKGHTQGAVQRVASARQILLQTHMAIPAAQRLRDG